VDAAGAVVAAVADESSVAELSAPDSSSSPPQALRVSAVMAARAARRLLEIFTLVCSFKNVHDGDG
jgi:hypothetical protein